MLEYRHAVVGADIDIDAEHLAVSHQLAQRGVVDQRAAMRDAGFDDQVRSHVPQDFLHGDHVLRVLDDRPAHPSEIIGVLGVDRITHEVGCVRLDARIPTKRANARGDFVVETGHG